MDFYLKLSDYDKIKIWVYQDQHQQQNLAMLNDNFSEFEFKEENEKFRVKFLFTDQLNKNQWPEYQKNYNILGSLGIVSDQNMQAYVKRVQDFKIRNFKIIDQFTLELNSNDVTQMQQDIVQNILAQIKKLQTDDNFQQQISLFNINEEKLQNQTQIKKRKQGRIFKVIADLYILMNNLIMADKYLLKAQDHTKSNNDYLWQGGVMESQAFIAYQQNQDFFIKMKEALMIFKKTKFTNFEVQNIISTMDLIVNKSQSQYKYRQIFLEYLQQILSSFPILNEQQNILLFSILIDNCEKLNFKRKAAYLTFLVSQHVPSKPEISMELILKIGKFYGIIDQKKTFWPKLQISIINHILALESVPNYIKKTILIENLQIFSKQAQFQNLQSIMQFIKDEDDLLYNDLSLFPELVSLKVLVQENFSKVKDIEVKDIFYFNPFKKNETQKNLILEQNQNIDIQLIFKNQFDHDIQIDQIEIHSLNNQIINYPQFYQLQKNSTTQLILSIQFLNDGNASLDYLKIKVYNIWHQHSLVGKIINNPIITIINNIPKITVIIPPKIYISQGQKLEQTIILQQNHDQTTQIQLNLTIYFIDNSFVETDHSIILDNSKIIIKIQDEDRNNTLIQEWNKQQGLHQNHSIIKNEDNFLCVFINCGSKDIKKVQYKFTYELSNNFQQKQIYETQIIYKNVIQVRNLQFIKDFSMNDLQVQSLNNQYHVSFEIHNFSENNKFLIKMNELQIIEQKSSQSFLLKFEQNQKLPSILWQCLDQQDQYGIIFYNLPNQLNLKISCPISIEDFKFQEIENKLYQNYLRFSTSLNVRLNVQYSPNNDEVFINGITSKQFNQGTHEIQFQSLFFNHQQASQLILYFKDNYNIVYRYKHPYKFTS